MLNEMPTVGGLNELLGTDSYKAFEGVCRSVENLYDMEKLWDSGGKAWSYVLRYRRGGKTLCTLCLRDSAVAFMIIFGKEERAKVETQRDAFSAEVIAAYDDANTYHDGKWVLLNLPSEAVLEDLPALLAVKRKPNKKTA